MSAEDGIRQMLHQLALRTRCPKCHALVGRPCRNFSDGAVLYLHGQRRSPVEAAYALGFTEGAHSSPMGGAA